MHTQTPPRRLQLGKILPRSMASAERILPRDSSSRENPTTFCSERFWSFSATSMCGGMQFLVRKGVVVEAQEKGGKQPCQRINGSNSHQTKPAMLNEEQEYQTHHDKAEQRYQGCLFRSADTTTNTRIHLDKCIDPVERERDQHNQSTSGDHLDILVEERHN